MKTFCTLLLAAASLHAATLTLSLQTPPNSGQLRVLLFDSPDTFGDLRNPVFSKTIPATGQSEIILTNIPDGRYALMVHHDENSDGTINKNFIGIPREPVGFANGYSPKGPPSFRRALLLIDAENNPPMQMELRRPLGSNGRFGAGIGVLFSTSPYRGSDRMKVLPIPAITYTGERLQVFGSQARYMLTDNDSIRLALGANYRPAAYEENDSAVLTGLGDRDSTLLAGPELKAELPKGMDLALGYRHDVLNQIGGGEAFVSINKSYSAGIARLTPSLGLRWISGELTRHDYGTPGYRPGSMVSLEAALNTTIELTENWWFVGRLGVEQLGSEAADSPITDRETVINGFLSFSYLF